MKSSEIIKRLYDDYSKNFLGKIFLAAFFSIMVAGATVNTVGYKEIFQYLNKQTSLEFAIAEIKKNTRRFAKRQLTWLRKEKDILWVNFDANLEDVIAQIENKQKANQN